VGAMVTDGFVDGCADGCADDCGCGWIICRYVKNLVEINLNFEISNLVL
jgi:hypothetical protein